MIDAVVVIDLAGRVILTNTAAATLSGYSQRELRELVVGQLFEDAVSGVRTRVRNKIAAGDPLRREEAWLVTKSKERVPVSIMASPIAGQGDTEIVLVARDAREARRLLIERDVEIARRREVEAQLRLLAGSVGHELRNILQVQVDSIEAIQHAIEGGGSTAEVSVILGDLERVSDHLIQHAKQLLQLAKPRREVVESLSVGEIVQDVTKMLQRAGRLRGITIELADVEPSPRVYASRQRIEQIFVNLILNGAEAIEAPGTISIKIAAVLKDRVEITVLDTGSGISPETLGRIFEPYFTTKGDDGTGLGLSIVRDLVEGYGGKLTVASTVGQGTTFRLDLPIDRSQ